MHPNPGEFCMPKSMFVLNMAYDCNRGSLIVFAQVFAIGNGELVKNSMRGCGTIPAGGSDDSPVENINKSSRDTVVGCCSARRKTTTLYCIIHMFT